MFWLFLLLAFFYGIFLSVGAIFIEEITYRRYPQWSSLIRLMVYGVLENLGYRQINACWRMQALVQLALGKDAWERVSRRNFNHISMTQKKGTTKSLLGEAAKESPPATAYSNPMRTR